MIEGKVIRINGPIIKATGLGASGLYDVVEIGEKRLIGEIIRLEADTATIQIYEENTGMRVGESAWSLERPLSVHLGPGLLGRSMTAFRGRWRKSRRPRAVSSLRE